MPTGSAFLSVNYMRRIFEPFESLTRRVEVRLCVLGFLATTLLLLNGYRNGTIANSMTSLARGVLMAVTSIMSLVGFIGALGQVHHGRNQT